VLEEYAEDNHKLKELLTGKRVELAEELSMLILLFKIEYHFPDICRTSTADPRAAGGVCFSSEQGQMKEQSSGATLFRLLLCNGIVLLHLNCVLISSFHQMKLLEFDLFIRFCNARVIISYLCCLFSK
jgi:hypothetical protein